MFRHSAPRDPNSAVAGQIGSTLIAPVPFANGVIVHSVGVAATAASAVVDSSVVNFLQ
jgi:hypothetical protein